MDAVALATFLLFGATVGLAVGTGFLVRATFKLVDSSERYVEKTNELVNATKDYVTRTGDLVEATKDYSTETQQIIREMKAGRQEGLMPVLTCDLKQAFPTFADVMENDVIVSNVGNAPALEARFELSSENYNRSFVELPHGKAYRVGTLGVGQSSQTIIDKSYRRKDETKSEDPLLEIRLFCKNAYGIEFRTIKTYELNLKKALEANQADTYQWRKLTESFTIIPGTGTRTSTVANPATTPSNSIEEI